MREENPVKLTPKDCGKHYGKESGPCKKCAYFARQEAEDRRKGLLMHNGTPWIMLLGDVVHPPPGVFK